jgi:hydrogenase maturation protease
MQDDYLTGKNKMKTVVLGLGNTLLGDDGVGIHAVDRLQSDWAGHGNVVFVDGGTLSFTLTEILADADKLIVIDAAQLGAQPGTVNVFVGEDMDRFVRSGKCSSVHEVSLAELLDMVRLTDDLPLYRALVGIQPDKIDWDEKLTPEIENAIPFACQHATSLLEQWQ